MDIVDELNAALLANNENPCRISKGLIRRAILEIQHLRKTVAVAERYSPHLMHYGNGK